jgi:hypothetical protein
LRSGALVEYESISAEGAMDAKKESQSAKIRARLGHPVIDSDGHSIESIPVFLDYLKTVGGSGLVEKFRTVFHDTIIDPRWASFSLEERRYRRGMKPVWWANAANTRDLATAVLPKLMHERLPELGLDFSVVYPTMGLATDGFASLRPVAHAPRPPTRHRRRRTLRQYSYAPSIFSA